MHFFSVVTFCISAPQAVKRLEPLDMLAGVITALVSFLVFNIMQAVIVWPERRGASIPSDAEMLKPEKPPRTSKLYSSGTES